MQQDGVFNVRQFQTGLPNGQWRVIVLTDDLGPDQGAANPFGTQVRLNGQALRVGGGSPDQWLPGGGLGPSDVQGGGTGIAGGMLLTEVAVENGRLVIEFGDGVGTYITGIILQPAEEPSLVRLSGPSQSHFAQLPNLQAAIRARVAQALGDVLTRVATAAGPNQLAQALQANQVINQATEQASEN